VHVGVKVGENGLSIIRNSAAAAAVDSTSDLSPASSVDFSVELTPDVWHQMSLGVYHRHVTLHVDCDVTMTLPWRHRVGTGGDGQLTESSIVLSIGKAFIESSRYPRFEVSSRIY